MWGIMITGLNVCFADNLVLKSNTEKGKNVSSPLVNAKRLHCYLRKRETELFGNS